MAEDWNLEAQLRKSGLIWPADRVRRISIEPQDDRLTVEFSHMDIRRKDVAVAVRRLREEAREADHEPAS